MAITSTITVDVVWVEPKAGAASRASLFGLATNLFNHPNLGNPSMDITSPATVGQITGIQTDGNAGVGVRQLRIGLRVGF